MVKQISEAIHSDRYALVIIDGAGWHTDDIAKHVDNLTALKLPPLFSRAKSNRADVAVAKTALFSQEMF